MRDDEGNLQVASLARGARAPRPRGLTAARDAKGVGVLVGGRVSAEDAYAYSKFTRLALQTNDIDFRARPHSVEEAQFLASHVVATGPEGDAVTYADIERARTVVLVGFEPEDESPIVFLRLRKAFRKNKTDRVRRGAVRHPRPGEGRRHARSRRRPAPRPRSWRRWPTAPTTAATPVSPPRPRRWPASGRSCCVGERLAGVPGALSAAGGPGRLLGGPPGVDPAPCRRAGRAGDRRAARRCCPAAARSPSPPPAPRSARPGASSACPSRVGPRHRRDHRRRRRGPAGRARWSAASTRPTCPSTPSCWTR